jgi:Cof subfamily protein (haloacid dehalogenase superfamily)
MEKKGLLAFDIDGTLTHRLDWIDPKVVDYLKQLEREGWQIALATGRIFSFAWNILQHLDFPYLLAVQNGADILEMPSKKSLKRNYLSSSILPQIEESYQGCAEDYILYAGIDGGDFCYYRPAHFSEKMLKYLKVLESLGAAPWQPSDFAFPSEFHFPLIKCFGEKGAMERLNDRLKRDPEIEVSMIHDPVDRSLYLNLITHPLANKGEVIRFLREYTKSKHVIAAGDDRNDLKMLQAADVAIAIETAPKEVLDVAHIHAKPPNDYGILEALALLNKPF